MECKERADEEQKDPYVMWVWMITPDFQGEPDGVPMKADPTSPDSYYLLHFMRAQCKTKNKDWKLLAREVMANKDAFTLVKARFVKQCGFAGVLVPEPFDE